MPRGDVVRQAGKVPKREARRPGGVASEDAPRVGERDRRRPEHFEHVPQLDAAAALGERLGPTAALARAAAAVWRREAGAAPRRRHRLLLRRRLLGAARPLRGGDGVPARVGRRLDRGEHRLGDARPRARLGEIVPRDHLGELQYTELVAADGTLEEERVLREDEGRLAPQLLGVAADALDDASYQLLRLRHRCRLGCVNSTVVVVREERQ